MSEKDNMSIPGEPTEVPLPEADEAEPGGSGIGDKGAVVAPGHRVVEEPPRSKKDDPLGFLGLTDEEKKTWEKNVKIITDPESTVEAKVQAAKGLANKEGYISRPALRGMLHGEKIDEEKIDAVMNHADLPPDLPKEKERGEGGEDPVTDTEMEQIEDAMKQGGVLDEAQVVTQEGREIEEFAEGLGEEPTDEEKAELKEKLDDFVQKRKGIMQKIRESSLFKDETGLLRKDGRFGRLVAKPIAGVLMAMMLAYILSLHAVTKGAAKKIGGSS